MKYPGWQDHFSIFGNFPKICCASPWTWKIENIPYVPGHSKFDAVSSRYAQELDKWNTHSVRTIRQFLGIFWKSAGLLLGFRKPKGIFSNYEVQEEVQRLFRKFPKTDKWSWRQIFKFFQLLCHNRTILICEFYSFFFLNTPMFLHCLEKEVEKISN